MANLLVSNNAEYHANRTHLSSSGLKLILKSPEQFHRDYVLNQRVEQYSQAFEDGTLLHTLILEEHTLLENYAIYAGLRRAGGAFEAFKAENPGKKIITAAQLSKVEAWYSAFRNVKVANEIISGGLAEHTMLGEVLGVQLKARADYINIDKGYIADVKTTAQVTDIDIFRHTMCEYRYDLSAALYCELARQNYNKLFDFYFVVVSKQDGGCAVYKASSPTLTEGTAYVTMALVLYKKCLASGIWSADQPRMQFSDEILEV